MGSACSASFGTAIVNAPLVSMLPDSVLHAYSRRSIDIMERLLTYNIVQRNLPLTLVILCVSYVRELSSHCRLDRHVRPLVLVGVAAHWPLCSCGQYRCITPCTAISLCLEDASDSDAHTHTCTSCAKELFVCSAACAKKHMDMCRNATDISVCVHAMEAVQQRLWVREDMAVNEALQQIGYHEPMKVEVPESFIRPIHSGILKVCTETAREWHAYTTSHTAALDTQHGKWADRATVTQQPLARVADAYKRHRLGVLKESIMH